MATYSIQLSSRTEPYTIEANNRVEAIRQAQIAAARFGANVLGVSAGVGDTTPFVADEQSQLPTALGIAGQVQGQASPLGFEVTEPVTNMNAPMFATNEEQAALLALAEQQRKDREEQIRLAEEQRRQEEEERRRLEAAGSEMSSAEQAFAREGYLQANNPVIDPNVRTLISGIGSPDGVLTRKLIGAVYSPGKSAYYRKYEYSNGDIVSFLVDINNIDDKPQAFQHEQAVTEETYAARLEINTIQANNLLANETITGVFRDVADAFKRRAGGGLSAKTQEQINGKLKNWFIQELTRQGKKIDETEDDGDYTYSFDFAESGETILPPFRGEVTFDPIEEEIENVEIGFGEGTGTGEGDNLEVGDVATDFGMETGMVPGFAMGDASFASTDVISGPSAGSENNVLTVDPAGGSMTEILAGYGVDVGPFGVISDDMPGLPPDFFDRDDYYVDVTSVTRDINPLFNRIETQYQTNDAGIRIDSAGQPEYLESIKIDREVNPEIGAALEAYKLALQAKTNLSGNIAQVLSTHINATDGLGVGKDAFTAPEIANLRQNLALISATEGLVTFDVQGQRQLNQQLQEARLQEIAAAQRPDVQRQLVDIYSNPVAYGILSSTPEGLSFLNNLQSQATFTPFGQQQAATDSGFNVEAAGISAPTMGTEISPLGGTTTTPLTSETATRLPTAREFTTASEVERGRLLADAARRGIFGEQDLISNIASATPAGADIAGSVLAPFTLGASTEANPFGGAVTASGNPGSIAATYGS